MGSAAQHRLELVGASRSYGDATALLPVDLSFAEGRTTALLGPSGCGKSTCLRLLIGLTSPDQGQVLFGGEAVGADNVLALRRNMGYVIQEGGLFPHLSAEDNVCLMARHLGWESARLGERLREVAELVSLDLRMLSRFPSQLSGGQRQRVSLMRALMLDPAVLLLDEPLGALDPMIRRRLQEDLRSIFRRHDRTVVLVTHDLSEAAYLADEIVLMQEGAVVQKGTLRQLLDTPATPFVREFILAQRSPISELES